MWPNPVPAQRVIRLKHPMPQNSSPHAINLVNTTQHDAADGGNSLTPSLTNPSQITHSWQESTWPSGWNCIGRCSIRLSELCEPHEQISGNNTVIFIKRYQVPSGCKVTFYDFVCTMQPNKTEVYRVLMSIGSDWLDAYQSVLLPAGILDAKISRYCMANITDFFLCSTMQI